MVHAWKHLGDDLATMIEDNKKMIVNIQDDIIQKNRLLGQTIKDLERQQELILQRSKRHAEVVGKLQELRKR